MKHGLALLVAALPIGLGAAGNGISSGEFLSLPTSARTAAMGQSGVAVAEGAEALAINPAGLKSDGKSVLFSHGAYLDSSYTDNLAYAQGLGRGALGVGLRYFSAGNIEFLDSNANPAGSETPNDLAASIGYGLTTPIGNLGVAGKYVRSKLVDTATTFTADLGYLSPGLMNGNLHLGAAGTNLFGSLTYDQEAEDLPRAFRAGAAYTLKPNWDLSAEASFPKGADTFYGLGTEYRLKVGEGWGFGLRGGYSTETEDIDGFTGFSMGLGVTRGALVVDYAFLPFGDVGSTHWITLGYRLGKKN